MNKPDLIASIVAEARTPDGSWLADHVAKLLAEKYLEDADLVDSLALKAARHDVDKWEHARTPKPHDVEGQGRLFYEPDAILILGGNDRIIMSTARPVHARRRVRVLTHNLAAQLAAMQTELSYWDDRMEEWPEDRTLDDIERTRFGFIDPPEPSDA